MTYCRELGRKTFLKKFFFGRSKEKTFFLDVPRKKVFLEEKKDFILVFLYLLLLFFSMKILQNIHYSDSEFRQQKVFLGKKIFL